MKNNHRIVEKHGCTIVYGSLPIRELSRLLDGDPDRLVSSKLATQLGAAMVIGAEADLEALARDPSTLAASRATVKAMRGDYPLSPEAIRWLEQGERGLSSESMFRRFTGFPALKAGNYPRDMSDFRRCRLLLEWVPEFQSQLSSMATVSPEWERLVEAWAQICAAMDEEAPGWREGNYPAGSAPRAGALLRAAIRL